MVIYLVESKFFDCGSVEIKMVLAFLNQGDAEQHVKKLYEKYHTYEYQRINTDFLEDGYYDSYFEYQDKFAEDMRELDPKFQPYYLDYYDTPDAFSYRITEIELR